MSSVSDVPSMVKVYGDSIQDVNFMTNVAGTTFVKNSNKLLRFLKEKIPIYDVILRLVREPENEYDVNAVRVEVSIKGSKKYGKLGYIPKDRAQLLSYVLDNKDKYDVDIHDISIVGGDRDKPNMGIFFNYNIIPLNNKNKGEE